MAAHRPLSGLALSSLARTKDKEASEKVEKIRNTPESNILQELKRSCYVIIAMKDYQKALQKPQKLLKVKAKKELVFSSRSNVRHSISRVQGCVPVQCFELDL